MPAGDYVLQIEHGGSPMINEAKVADLIQKVAAELLGDEHIHAPRREMGSEDFGAFLEQAPGAMFALGCLIEGDERKAHSPRFDIDERCLPVGAAILAEAALRLLHQ